MVRELATRPKAQGSTPPTFDLPTPFESIYYMSAIKKVFSINTCILEIHHRVKLKIQYDKKHDENIRGWND